MYDAMLWAVLVAVVAVMAPFMLWACIIAWELVKHPPKHR
jgi:hypothetical protein